jgi:exodeoxyribonuclease-3
MKIISWNVNGLRAIERKKELESFLNKYDPDVFLMQEIKAEKSQLINLEKKYDNYEKFYNSAEKKGYSGTSIWIKKTCNEIVSSQEHHLKFGSGMPDFNDKEGRISRIDFKNFTILGVYFPNGGKSKEAWEGKLIFYEKFLNYVNKLRKNGRQVIWCGDVNCAHNVIDLARPKNNEGKIGFHPKERAWIDKCIDQDWIDIWRNKYPKKTDVYSWWHVITRSRLKNVGWRIDYFFLDKKLIPSVKNIEYLNDQMGSDHCPVLLEI